MTKLLDDDMATQRKILQLNEEVFRLRRENLDLKGAFVETNSKLNDLEEIPVPPSVIKQIIQMEAVNRKLKDDLDYYKKHVDKRVLINKENKKPIRKGGILRQQSKEK